MKNKTYTLYFYKYPQNMGYAELESILGRVGSSVSVDVREISDEENEEKGRIVNAVVSAERLRRYEAGKEKQAYIHLFKYSKTGYFAVVSICEADVSEMDRDSLLKAVFNTSNSRYLSLSSDNSNNAYECSKFWKEKIGAVQMMGKRDKQYFPDMDESIELDEELSEALSQSLKDSFSSVKIMATSALAKIICGITQSNSIMIEDIHDSGMINDIPIVFNDNADNKEEQSRIREYLFQAERYDMIDYENVRRYCNNDLSSMIMFSQYFISEHNFDKLLMKMDWEILYKLNPIEDTNSPLRVEYRWMENRKYIHYIFDSHFFKDISIRGLHEAFCVLMSNYLNKSFTDIDVSKYTDKKNDTKYRLNMVKAKCLSNLEMFKDYTPDEVEKLAAKCEVLHKFTQQTIINSGTSPDRLYFVISGRIEIDGIDEKKMIHPLSLLKNKDMFGIESFLLDREAKVNYVVQSNDAVIMSIPVEVFSEEAVKHPMICKVLLDEQSRRLYKFQKLWMMS